MEQLIKNSKAYSLLSSRKSRLKHAYLLLYPDAKYLRDALKIFAELFFDKQMQTDEQKGRVSSLIRKEAYADCIFYPEEGKKFTVANAASVEEECCLRPVEGETKLIVIGDFSDATIEAQNKLLKLLEEPNDCVRFLLGATSSFSVLPTVLSRVEKIEISPFSDEEIAAFLHRSTTSFSSEEIALCARSGGGIAGKAYDLLLSESFKELLNGAWEACLCTASAVPSVVKKYGETKYKKEFLSLLKIVFFDALRLKSRQEGRGDLHFSPVQSEMRNLQILTSKYTYARLLETQKILSDCEKQLYFNGNFTQVLELALAKIKESNER